MHALKVIDIAQAVNGRLHPPQAEVEVSEVSIDTRTLPPGALYIALRGERYDGHQFVQEAVQRGAAAVLVEEGKWGQLRSALGPPAVPAVLVPDSLRALQALAAWRRAALAGPVVGVTGSNGKTTTKDMVAAVLSRRYRVLATRGNWNNEIGLPLTLLQLRPDHEAIVLEMGMRGSGEIARLAQVARPTVGVVTNVGPVHVELLGSLDRIADAKAELVAALPSDGVAVLNADDPRVAGMAAKTDARVLTFGLHADADVRATEVQSRGFAGVWCRVHAPSGTQELLVPVPGVHNVYNALAAIAVGEAVGVPVEQAPAAFRNLQRTAMRLEPVRLAHGIMLLNDAYNASPASVEGALNTLAGLPGAQRIAVLGDMLELGYLAASAHRRIGEICARTGLDFLVVTGRWAGEVVAGALEGGMPEEAIARCEDAAAAVERVAERVVPHAVILVKASRGLRLERVVDGLRERIGPAAEGPEDRGKAVSEGGSPR